MARLPWCEPMTRGNRLTPWGGTLGTCRRGGDVGGRLAGLARRLNGGVGVAAQNGTRQGEIQRARDGALDPGRRPRKAPRKRPPGSRAAAGVAGPTGGDQIVGRVGPPMESRRQMVQGYLRGRRGAQWRGAVRARESVPEVQRQSLVGPDPLAYRLGRALTHAHRASAPAALAAGAAPVSGAPAAPAARHPGAAWGDSQDPWTPPGTRTRPWRRPWGWTPRCMRPG